LPQASARDLVIGSVFVSWGQEKTAKLTSWGYVSTAAISFAKPAAPTLPVQSTVWSHQFFGLPLRMICSSRLTNDRLICSYSIQCMVDSATPR
jgi:hypothetical protein